MSIIQAMAKTYRPGIGAKMGNAMLGALLRRGAGPGFMRLLTVPGRKTGQLHSTPVVPVESEDGHWLVSPFGQVGWVHNVRAAGQVTLQRGKRPQTFAATELEPGEAVAVLRRYLAMKPAGRIVKPYFDVTPDDSDEAFVAEAPQHPVFVLTPLPDEPRSS
jgi:deazaflavin-dependent oxidoreductase (nitroreductase family)